jgi:hypothetical protein
MGSFFRNIKQQKSEEIAHKLVCYFLLLPKGIKQTFILSLGRFLELKELLRFPH